MEIKTTTKHTFSIINGKLYSTKTAEVLVFFLDSLENLHGLFKTIRGRYFSVSIKQKTSIRENGDVAIELTYTDIQPLNQEHAQEIIGRYDPEKYMDMFGFVEDA